MPSAIVAAINLFVGPFGLGGGALLNAIGVPVSTGIIGKALGIGNKPGPKPTLTETAMRQPVPPRVSGYGPGRHFMAYCLYTRDHHDAAIDVGAFHDGQVNAITGYYLADVKLTLGAGGFVNTGEAGIFGDGNKVYIGTRLGLPTETAFAEVIAQIPEQWTTDHRGDGVVTGFVISKSVPSKDFATVYPTGGPNQMALSLVMERQLVFDWRDPDQDVADASTWRYSENAVLHLAHYELVRDNKDWDTHFAPTLAYWTAAANDADIPVPLGSVQAILTVAATPIDGSVTLSSAVGLAVGMSITISATGDTSLTETRTVTGVAGLVVGIDSALANMHPIGSQVTWESDGGAPATEPRYRSCVAHAHIDAHGTVIGNLLAAFDGWMAPRADGALIVYSGRYFAPTVTINSDHVVTYSIQDGVDEDSAVNSLALTYVSANHDYTVVDTDAWEDDEDIADRGKRLSDTLANQVISHTQARRLAKRKMAQNLAPKRGTFTTNAAGRIAIGQRYIHLSLQENGETYLDAPVEIMKLTRNLTTGGVSCDWVLADPNIDAWNPATEEGLPAPVGNRIAPEPLAPPTVATARFFGSDDSGSGTSGARVRITVTADDRDDLTWFARWRVIGAVSWNEQQYTDIAAGPSIVLETGFVPVSASIEVEVAYEVGDGRVSDWSSPPTTVLTGSVTADSTTITADSTSITADRT